jgi:hypothetical protein
MSNHRSTYQPSYEELWQAQSDARSALYNEHERKAVVRAAAPAIVGAYEERLMAIADRFEKEAEDESLELTSRTMLRVKAEVIREAIREVSGTIPESPQSDADDS